VAALLKEMQISPRGNPQPLLGGGQEIGRERPYHNSGGVDQARGQGEKSSSPLRHYASRQTRAKKPAPALSEIPGWGEEHKCATELAQRREPLALRLGESGELEFSTGVVRHRRGKCLELHLEKGVKRREGSQNSLGGGRQHGLIDEERRLK